MKAIIVGTDSSHSLSIGDVPSPPLHPDEVLIHTRAFGINHADLLQRMGNYPPPPGASSFLGLEVSGEIEAVGSNVTTVSPGVRVMALLSGGGYAEYVACPAPHILPLPESLSFEEGAAFPEVFCTAYLSLFQEGRFRSGETVLIHGGGSGVGTAAIQLIRTSGGLPIVTVGSDDKRKRCVALGAIEAINYHTECFKDQIRSSHDGVDLILDMVGGTYFSDHLDLLRQDGRLVTIALQEGKTATIDLAQVLRKRLHIIGSTLRNQTLEKKAEILQILKQNVLPKIIDGTIQIVMDQVFEASQIEHAHTRMKERQHFGKIVVKW